MDKRNLALVLSALIVCRSWNALVAGRAVIKACSASSSGGDAHRSSLWIAATRHSAGNTDRPTDYRVVDRSLPTQGGKNERQSGELILNTNGRCRSTSLVE